MDSPVRPGLGLAGRLAPPARLLGLPRAFAHLRTAYRAGGAVALFEAHRAAGASPSYRLAVRCLDAVFPLSRTVSIAACFDELVRELGVYRASNRVLDELGVARETVSQADGLRTALTASAVVCCNHSSVLAPLLLLGSLDRADLKIVAMDYVAGLGPDVGRHVLPIARAYRFDPWTELRAGLSCLLPDLAIEYFVARQGRRAARQNNRLVLGQAADHVRQGGAVAIFPQGGGGRRWLPGIGVLGALLRDPGGSRSTQVVPVQIENDSLAAARDHLAGFRGGRLGRARPPIRVTIGRPALLERAVPTPRTSAAEIAAALERRWARTGWR